MTWWQILLIILAVILVLLVVLYFVGSKMQRKQAASQEQMDAMKQTLSMLIIDKKKMKLKDANLPDMVLQQTPKYMRRMKMPFVKAKVGPRIMTLIADPKVYEILPVKKEVFTSPKLRVYAAEQSRHRRRRKVSLHASKKIRAQRIQLLRKQSLRERKINKAANKKPCIALIHGFLFYYLLISFAVGESEAKFHYR